MDIDVDSTPASSSKAVIFGLGALCGALAGAVAGYLIAQHKYTQPIGNFGIDESDFVAWPVTDESEPEEDILVVVDGNIVLDQEDSEGKSPGPAVVYNKPVAGIPIDPTPPPTPHDIFAHTGEGWDYELEVRNRQTNMPYVIHKDEFFENEEGRRQNTYTYYEGDNIMVDELETVIYNHAGMMGDLKFGHGSGDPSVVYIRNEALKHEWEILLHKGEYTQEVLGHRPELDVDVVIKHSARRLLED